MQHLPYGMWKSKIDPNLVAARGGIGTIAWDSFSGEDQLFFSCFSSGKSCLYEKAAGSAPRQINGELAVGGTVGYGGGDFGVKAGKIVFCSNNGELYSRSFGRSVNTKIAFDQLDKSSPALSPDGRFAAFVASDGTNDCIALINLSENGWTTRWISGADFYMQPAWSPNGDAFVWAEWNHPEMPWTGSVVRIANLDPDSKQIREILTVAGGPESPASQPLFSPDGEWISYIQNVGEWENLVLINRSSGTKQIVIQGDQFALSEPAFSQGDHTYDWFADSRRIAYTRIAGTESAIFVKNLQTGEDQKVSPDRYNRFEMIAVSKHRGVIAAAAASPFDTAKLITIDGTKTEIVFHLQPDDIPEEWISKPQDLEWKSKNGTTIHGIYYPPCNPDYAWEGTPPAIVYIHGGPTGKVWKSFSAETAFFTSQGYGYLAVNYRGSHGFGRSYLDSLNGYWGEYDTEDAVTGAAFLGKQGLAREDQLLITGGSAGGFTTLNALCQYPNVFRAGASLYGVANLYGIVADTHKLELHYTDTLVGTLPEANQKFIDRSAFFHADLIKAPLAVFQGDKDSVVPPTQSEELVKKLTRPVVYRLYEGEGHGFRKPETILDYLQTVSSFLREYVIR